MTCETSGFNLVYDELLRIKLLHFDSKGNGMCMYLRGRVIEMTIQPCRERGIVRHVILAKACLWKEGKSNDDGS